MLKLISQSDQYQHNPALRPDSAESIERRRESLKAVVVEAQLRRFPPSGAQLALQEQIRATPKPA